MGIAALALAGTQAVSIQSLAEQSRGYQACLNEKSFDICKARQVNKCEDEPAGTRRYENWQCIELEGNGLAQIKNVSNSTQGGGKGDGLAQVGEVSLSTQGGGKGDGLAQVGEVSLFHSSWR